MEQISLKVFAKLNLMLDIKGVLDDGYHSLDMVMESCSLFDEITCEKSLENEVYMDGVLQDDKNTAKKALDVLTLAYGYRMKVDIKKHIPMSAGVGGSSADAAGVFFAYGRLYGIDYEYMTKLALSIGSDVVYMMKGGPARVRCKGEMISPIETFNERYLVIIQKAQGASTKDVYKKYDDIGRIVDSSFEDKGQEFFNVLTAPAIALSPSIKDAFDELSKHTNKVFMTGSGSAVCGLFDTKKDADEALEKIGEDFAFKASINTLPKGIEILEEV